MQKGLINPLRDWIERRATRTPDKNFIESIDQNSSISFAELRDEVNRFSQFLAGRGIGTNDRVTLLSGNSLEHLICYLAVMAHGASICTVNIEMNTKHLEEIMNRLAPSLVIYQEEAVERTNTKAEWVPIGLFSKGEGRSGIFSDLAQYQPKNQIERLPFDRDNDACIYFTSGTTDQPKGVILSFGDLIDNVLPTVDGFQITEVDRILDYRSFNWASAQILSCLCPLAVGGTLLLAQRFSRSRFFKWVGEHRPTIAAGNPTIINMLMSLPAEADVGDVNSLRFITSSSAPLTIQEWKRFEKRFGIAVAQGYGSSETGWVAGSNEHARRLGSVGKPHAYHNLKVVDGEGLEKPAGEIGHIEMGSNPNLLFRQLGADGTQEIVAKGRIRSGDVGYVDDDGYLYVSGREKDLIIRGGVNIAPVEIDNILLQMRQIAEAVTVGVKDPVYGEEIICFVVISAEIATDTISEEDVLTHCRHELPDFKMPKKVVFQESLPKTQRGKLDRSAVKAQWESRNRSQ